MTAPFLSGIDEPFLLITPDRATTTAFTGGSLVRAPRHHLLAWLAEYGIELRHTE